MSYGEAGEVPNMIFSFAFLKNVLYKNATALKIPKINNTKEIIINNESFKEA